MYVKFCNFGNYGDKKGLSDAPKDLKSSVGLKDQQYPDVNRRVRLYRIISAILLLLCVLLLVVVLSLAMKRQDPQLSLDQFAAECEAAGMKMSTSKSETMVLSWKKVECPVSEVETKQECIDVERTNVAEVCNRQKCEEMYPRQIDPAYSEHLCSECGKGWLKFESSCYFLSNHRLTWRESREQCQKWGGDLVVISNERVQTFLTEKGPMLYWIGLRDLGTEQWTWINNTAVIHSYWNQHPTAGHCALLRGWKSPQNNWISNPCVINSHYICQKG